MGKPQASTGVVTAYYQLTKPGIIYGNALPTIAGFLVAAQSLANFWLLIAVLVGQSLIIASACVTNNYIDRDIDIKMDRTKRRALVTGQIGGRSALLFAAILGAVGSLILIRGTNFLTLSLGLVGWVVYVVLYGYTKRHGRFGTLVGSIAGALPPVAGYTAVTDRLDLAALLLFAILVCWQMPHFYAIAMFRLRDYQAAALPVLPARRGFTVTKLRILGYIVAFIFAVTALTIAGYTGYIALIGAGGIGLAWLWKAVHHYAATDDTKWARQMFFFSLNVLLVTCAAISIDRLAA